MGGTSLFRHAAWAWKALSPSGATSRIGRADRRIGSCDRAWRVFVWAIDEYLLTTWMATQEAAMAWRGRAEHLRASRHRQAPLSP